MTRDGGLRRRAERAGVLPRYRGAGGRVRRPSEATLAALLEALGPDAGAAPGRARSPVPRCVGVEDVPGARRAFGVWANLYALRGRDDLGVGDLGAVRELVRLAADAGAAFVGLSPLHAIRARGSDVSPYSPVSRLFRSPLHLELRAVPELDAAPEVRARLDDPAGPFRREAERLRAAPHIDYAAAAALREPVLRALHAAGRAGRAGEARQRAFATWRRRAGTNLERFAVFRALEEHLAAAGHPRDWPRWPARFRDPEHPAVDEFARAHAGEVDFHAWLQFEVDRQLAAAADEGRRAGLAVGLYTDLALGSDPGGFDTWAFPGLFVDGARLGAPPDAYAAEGQDWGLPPAHPARLVAGGRDFLRALLDAGFAHAGALRVDHVMGLVRQYWIPRGRPASDGAYVRFPAAALLDELADASRRHGALVVGEDLGTVPAGLATRLAARRILSSRVLLFERTRSGGFRASARWSRRALVTANTHDLPTLRGWWEERDLDLLAGLGRLAPAQVTEAREARARDRHALERRLRAEGCLGRRERADDPVARCRAVSAFLCRTPAPLAGLALDDLAGETEPVNLPGVPPDEYPSWTRRMGRSVAALAAAPDVARALEGARSRARRPRAARTRQRGV